MNVAFKVIVSILLFQSLQGKQGKTTYEMSRPIQYFFRLLELKSDFNPLLYPTTLTGTGCSSKTGPFCKLTKHNPIQTHEMLDMTAQISNYRLQLLATVKPTYDAFRSIEKGETQGFLIRNELGNLYDKYARRQMGEMSKGQMLPSSKFKKTNVA